MWPIVVETLNGPSTTFPMTASEILEKLSKTKELEVHGVPLPRWPDKVEAGSRVVLLAALVSFLILFGLAGMQAQVPLPRLWRDFALFMGVIAYLLALLSVALNTVAGGAGLWMSQRKAGEIRAFRCERDLGIARWLSKQDQEEIQVADKWLEQHSKRIDARLSLFFGGVDNVALFALLGVGWITWKEVLNASLESFGSPLWFGMAFLTGLAVGGIMQRRALQQIAYHRDLIALSKQPRGIQA